MASLASVPGEILLTVADQITASFSRTSGLQALAALSHTNRRLNRIFEPRLYKYDAEWGDIAMAWGACTANVDTMAKALAQGSTITARSRVATFQWAAALRTDCPFFPYIPSPMLFAVARGDNAVIDWLLQHGGNINKWVAELEVDDLVGGSQRYRKCRSLFWAIAYNQPDTVQHLLRLGADPIQLIGLPDVRPIHLAAALGHESLFDALLTMPGCGIDDADERGYTALHYASRGYKSQTSIPGIRGLLQRGADATLVSRTGETALECSLTRNPPQWPAACELLETTGPQAFVRSDRLIVTAVRGLQSHGTPARSAACHTFLRHLLGGQPLSSLYPVQMLGLEAGTANFPLIRQDDRVSLLIWSILENKVDALPGWRPRLLLEFGAKADLADSRGRTPLHACVFKAMCDEEGDMFWYSVVPRYSPTTSGLDPCFPYDTAAELIRQGGSLDAEDDQGHTPLDYAVLAVDRHPVGTLRPVHAKRLRFHTRRHARAVVQFVLGSAWPGGPSDAVKTRLVARLGRDILHPNDPLLVREE